MKQLKNIITPFKNISSLTTVILIGVEVLLILLLWHYTRSELIPSPFKVIPHLLHIITTEIFIDNLIASLWLTCKAMFYSIIVALFFGYISTIPLFTPLSKLVVKLRYLGLTSLILIFTLIAGGNLKISLLMFGIIPFFVTSLIHVISQIDKQEYELCKTLRYNSWQTLYEVVIIGRLDQTIEVIRQNFAICWLMIVMVEGTSQSQGGLGVMLFYGNKVNNLTTILSLQIVILLIGIGLDLLLGYMRNWLFPYTKLEKSK